MPFVYIGAPMKSPELVPAPARPTWKEMYDAIQPLPFDTVTFGIASDGLPICLSLHDSVPRSLVLLGGPARDAAMSMALSTKIDKKDNTKFFVLTDQPDTWFNFIMGGNSMNLSLTDRCRGIIPLDDSNGVIELMKTLTQWGELAQSIHSTTYQLPFPVILFIDRTGDTRFPKSIGPQLQWLSEHGAEQRVWLVISQNGNINPDIKPSPTMPTIVYGSGCSKTLTDGISIPRLHPHEMILREGRKELLPFIVPKP